MDRDTERQSADELLMASRVVPVRREGNKVFVRTLRHGEEDTGEVVNVGVGDRVIFEPGALVVDSRQIDAQSVKGPGGYAPVANTVWTWYRIVGEEPRFFLSIFALARRIDAAHALWALAIQERDKAKQEGDIPRRAGSSMHWQQPKWQSSRCIGALRWRIRSQRSSVLAFSSPTVVQKVTVAVEAMRHAFEHIDDRAEGKTGMSRKVDWDALSIFHQPDFVESSVLRYKQHSLDFDQDVLSALLDCREFIMDAIDARASSKPEE